MKKQCSSYEQDRYRFTPVNAIVNLQQFRPPWYLRNGHVQTIITGFYKPKPKLPVPIAHKIPMCDPQHSFYVFENQPLKSNPDFEDSAVLLLHGMGSSHAGTYMTSMAKLLLERGVRVFRADLPGAGPSAHLTPMPPHGACYNEIWKALLFLRDELGIRRWRLSGVSLGGNVLLKLLAEKAALMASNGAPNEVSIERAVSVAPPIRLSSCSTHMESGLHRLYANYFLRTLRTQARYRANLWPSWKERLEHASYATIRKFDETVTAPLSGFSDAEDYYAKGSSADILHQIHVPTVILIDDHDPIVPSSMFQDLEISKSTEIKVTRHGGHVGYLHRSPNPESQRTLPERRLLNRWSDAWIVDELLR
jgi:uncharacterized protein